MTEKTVTMALSEYNDLTKDGLVDELKKENSELLVKLGHAEKRKSDIETRLSVEKKGNNLRMKNMDHAKSMFKSEVDDLRRNLAASNRTAITMSIIAFASGVGLTLVSNALI